MAPIVFAYPMASHERRHGPEGYSDYKRFKPWLRDEFSFRCVYCLLRENHHPDRQASFSVEHVVPRSIDPDLELVYDNVIYACSRCNSYRRDVWPLLDPCENVYGEHLRMGDDGEVEGLTQSGVELIRVLRLNHPEQVESRRNILLTLEILDGNPSPKATRIVRSLRGFPRNLPDLRKYHPLRGIPDPKAPRTATSRGGKGESCQTPTDESRPMHGHVSRNLRRLSLTAPQRTPRAFGAPLDRSPIPLPTAPTTPPRHVL